MVVRVPTPRFPEPAVPAGATSLPAHLRALAQAAPDAPAVSDGHDVMTRAELDAATDRLARAFAARGVGRGDLVSIALPNVVAHVACSVAAWKLGAVPQPLSARLPDAERDAVLAVAEPALTVGLRPPDRRWLDLEDLAVVADAAPAADEAPLPDVVGPSWKAPTSGGSTGRPKVIVSGQAACTEQVLARADGLRIDEDGVFLATAPLHHNAPYMFSLMALLQGHHVVLMQRFDAARALSLVGEYAVTWLYLVPTMMGRMLRLSEAAWREADLSSLRTALHVGAPCPPEVKRGWLARLPAPEILVELYSGTESQASAMIDGRDWLAHPGSVGPVTRGRMTVRDDDGGECPPGVVGEIWMRPDAGPTYHYLGARARTVDGWESLGDMGSFDTEGYLYLADRRADMILVGGANVYPAEVEAALLAHPDVADAVVVGVPDSDLGRVVHAVVQPAGHAGPDLTDRLLAAVAERLARHKIPRTVELVDHPLRDDAGKIRRGGLRPHEREAHLAHPAEAGVAEHVAELDRLAGLRRGPDLVVPGVDRDVVDAVRAAHEHQVAGLGLALADVLRGVVLLLRGAREADAHLLEHVRGEPGAVEGVRPGGAVDVGRALERRGRVHDPVAQRAEARRAAGARGLLG
jgi:bile acid-coenzyme A ligase